MNIVLLGFKSSGKSTLGKELALQLGYTFVDTDTLLENLYEKEQGERLDCRSIYTKNGASFMRELETRAVIGLGGTASASKSAKVTATQLERAQKTVVATGGGIILCEKAMSFLQHYGICVFLDLSLPILEQRLQGVQSPLFAQKSIAQVYAERYPLYRAGAKLQFCVDENISVSALARSLCEQLNNSGFSV